MFFPITFVDLFYFTAAVGGFQERTKYMCLIIFNRKFNSNQVLLIPYVSSLFTILGEWQNFYLQLSSKILHLFFLDIV